MPQRCHECTQYTCSLRSWGVRGRATNTWRTLHGAHGAERSTWPVPSRAYVLAVLTSRSTTGQGHDSVVCQLVLAASVSADFQKTVPQSTQFPRVRPSVRRNDEPDAGGRAILNSEAPRREIRCHSWVLLGRVCSGGRAFRDFEFVPMLVWTTIFVAGGAVTVLE